MVRQKNSSIKRGQVWMVALDPTVGSEARKLRPCAVVSHDHVGALPVRVVVPITGWQGWFAGNVWQVKLTPDGHNGLRGTTLSVQERRRGIADWGSGFSTGH